MKMNRYEGVLGFNTKQWWVYDTVENKLIDPPSNVLEVLKYYNSDTAEGLDIQQKILELMANSDPTWIHDTDYIYDGDMEI